MKKIVWVLSGINIILLTAIIILLKNNIESDEIRIETKFQNTKQFFCFYIARSDYKKTEYFEGRSESENAIEERIIKAADNVEVLQDIFSVCRKGTPIVRVDDDIIVAENDCCLLECDVSNNEVKLVLLNAEQEQISFSCPVNIAKQISNMQIFIEYDGKEYPASVKKVGYYVNGDNLEVSLSAELILLPGEEVQIKVITDTLHDVVAVENAFILHDNSGAYLYEDANKYSQGQEPPKIRIKELLVDDKYSIIEIDEVYLNGMVSSVLD